MKFLKIALMMMIIETTMKMMMKMMIMMMLMRTIMVTMMRKVRTMKVMLMMMMMRKVRTMKAMLMMMTMMMTIRIVMKRTIAILRRANMTLRVIVNVLWKLTAHRVVFLKQMFSNLFDQ
jgi:hypothetical protein